MANRWLVVGALCLGGCVIIDRSEDDHGAGGSGGGSGGSGGAPIGPVASNAEQAWPTKPEVAPISATDIVRACVAQARCLETANPETDLLLATELCVSQVIWSAERAIPLSGLLSQQERAEFFVRCAIDNQDDCTATLACATQRSKSIHCQEDGCRAIAGKSFDVSCDGPIATLSDGAETLTRDCARAFAECDSQSATGCTDRQFTQCPAGVSQADRCDGNVRLGCDGAGQVSYRDCERMGGSCGTSEDGKQDCIYKSPPDPGCESELALASCDGQTLELCVNGERVAIAAAGVCPAG